LREQNSGLVVLQVLLLLPEEQLPRQVQTAGRQEEPFGRLAGILAVGQDQRVALHVTGSQGHGFANPAARCPQHPQQQPVAAFRCGVDDRLHVGRRQPFRRLPALALWPDPMQQNDVSRSNATVQIGPAGTAGSDSPVDGIGGSFCMTP